jgi:nucleoside-specific outer membrane channel protein Tsx
MTRIFSATLLATGLLLAGTAAAQSTTVTFDDG